MWQMAFNNFCHPLECGLFKVRFQTSLPSIHTYFVKSTTSSPKGSVSSKVVILLHARPLDSNVCSIFWANSTSLGKCHIVTESRQFDAILLFCFILLTKNPEKKIKITTLHILLKVYSICNRFINLLQNQAIKP